MKKMIIGSLFAISCFQVMAQPPVRNTPTDTTSMQPYSSVDTLGANKQVPNDTSFTSGARTISTDSTNVRYAQGGKSSRDAAHTKKYAARKDTTQVTTYSRTQKTVKKSHKQSASTKAKSNKN